ncbi:MAG: radical SAM protein [Deltaproteobacteria bacterium]|nr:radical SAM protein [Deltaproteobacteria bacterium]
MSADAQAQPAPGTGGPRRPQILFLSPPLPYPKATVREDHIDYFYYRNTLEQGLFQLRQMHSWHPLHFLAQNLPVDALVLENPSWDRLAQAVRSRSWDAVAISFTVPLARKVLEMATWLRANAPGVEIIVGGYGTAIFGEDDPLSREIRSHVDHICQGDGLPFMRDYLYRRFGLDRSQSPRQDLVPTRNGLFRSRWSLFEQLNFVGALGCTNCCVFCATAQQYRGKKIPIATGRSLYELIHKAAERHPGIDSAIIYDENFLEDREQVLEFMRCLGDDPALLGRLSLTVFSSVRSIARFSTDELLRCGIGTIFIGVETALPQILDAEKLHKRRGDDLAHLFERLHSAGICTLGSMIVGWDGHTPDNIDEDIASFVALNPTFYQVVPLHPVPGTPLWRRLKAEQRIVAGYRYEDDGVARSNFLYRHFSNDQIEGRVMTTYRQLVDEGGPWPFRLAETLGRGARALAADPDPRVVARATAYRALRRRLLPLALVSRLLFRGRGFRTRWRRAVGELWRESPAAVVVNFALGLLLLPVLAASRAWGSLRFALSRCGDQPDTIERRYRDGERVPE